MPATQAYSFIMPYDGIVTSIYMEITGVTYAPPAGQQISPYVALVIAPPESNSFTVIPASITSVTTPIPGGVVYINNTPVPGNSGPISIPIAAGTRVTIICGHNIISPPLASGALFWVHAGAIELTF